MHAFGEVVIGCVDLPGLGLDVARPAYSPVARADREPRSMPGFSAPRLPAVIAVMSLLLVAPGMALAHGVQSPEQSWMMAWPVSLDAFIGLVAAAVLYMRGIKALRDKSLSTHRTRHWAFYGGLTAIFLALVTPLDVVSEHVLAMHQVQHLLLRGVAPMLLMLAVPAGPLVAGMPEVIRRWCLMPLMTQRAIRGALGLLSHPVICTLLYAGTLYLWQVPVVHEAALLNRALHYLMHISMMASGLLFFWRVFDTRPAPWGTAFPSRLVMLGAAMFANIPLGAIITLKEGVTYAAYDELGRWWGLTPMKDELLGGLVIWILGSMMGLFAMLWLLALWGRVEARQDTRRRQGFRPQRNAAGYAGSGAAERAERRRLGWSLAIVPLTVVAAMVLLALWLSMAGKSTLQ